MIYSTDQQLRHQAGYNVPGVVLAVSPNNSEMLINDQLLGRFYIYSAAVGNR